MLDVGFAPQPGDRKGLSASQTSSRVALPTTGKTVIVQVPSGGDVTYVRFGDSSVTATTDDFVILPGLPYALNRAPDTQTYIAGICASSETATVHINCGN